MKLIAPNVTTLELLGTRFSSIGLDVIVVVDVFSSTGSLVGIVWGEEEEEVFEVILLTRFGV